MSLAELLEELRSSRTITQTGWAAHSHKPGDVLVRFHDQSILCVLSVKDHTFLPIDPDEGLLNYCGEIQIRIDDRDCLMARAEFEFDVEIFGKIAMRGCYLDPGSLEWDYDCVYRVEFAYSRLEYIEAQLKQITEITMREMDFNDEVLRDYDRHACALECRIAELKSIAIEERAVLLASFKYVCEVKEKHRTTAFQQLQAEHPEAFR